MQIDDIKPFIQCSVYGGELVEKQVEKLLRGGCHTAVVCIPAEVVCIVGSVCIPRMSSGVLRTSASNCNGKRSQSFSLVIIDQQNTDIGYMGACFSPNGQRIYVSTNNEESVLYQYDLTAPVIRYTQLPLDTNRECLYSGGQLRLAPDGKLYWTSAWYNGTQFNYPYQDTMYHPVNRHLSVINDPDALGTACTYVRFGHYLGGKRTY